MKGWIAGALLAAAVAGVGAAEILRVAPLVRDGRILVSFEMTDAFTDEIRDAVHSGLMITFSYDIGLRRGTPFWIDRTIDSVTLSATVKYDNLTRRYQLSRTLDGRMDETRVTEDEEVVRAWLTRFERLPLFGTGPLEPNEEYYVRIRAQTRPRNLIFFLPWDRAAASAVGKFTFLP